MIELEDEPAGQLELAASWEFVTWQPDASNEQPAIESAPVSGPESEETPLQLADTWEYIRWTPPQEEAAPEAPSTVEPAASDADAPKKD